MTIEQTITIPANHRIFIELPPELPVGKAKITVTPQAEDPATHAYEAIKNLRGLAKRMGSGFTVERFIEERREDLRREEEKYSRFFQGKK